MDNPLNFQDYTTTKFNNHEEYFETIRRKSNVVYTIFVFTIIIVAIAVFSITLDVSIASFGTIRSVTETSFIRAQSSGIVKQSFVSENMRVQKGDLLYVTESAFQKEKEKYLFTKKQDVTRLISDLDLLLSVKKHQNFLSALYRQSYFNYRQKISEATTRLNKVQADFNRNKKLHTEKVIADAEFENFHFELEKAKNELNLLEEQQLSEWQNELLNYQRELQEINAQLAQIEKESESLIIKAPVSGVVQNVAGVYVGSTILANQELLHISPDTTLIVEAYVSPNDIGLIKKDMNVRFQIDAFNYNQWGLASGKVSEIASDIQMVSDQPVFKIRCRLDDNYLKLKNGYTGNLRKGMTLQARFMVTQRTLWQLMYDKIDDWVNPNTVSKDKQSKSV
jgi:multidrug resistance efflux pump